MDNRRRTPSDGKCSHCLWLGELKMWKVNRWQTTNDGCQVMPKAHISFGAEFIWPSGFGRDDFQKSANQKKELPVVAMFVNRSGQMSNL